MGGFDKIAPYLTNPLTLVGFVLLLFFSVHRLLIRSKILPPVSSTSSAKIVQTMLKFGFVTAIAVICAGFAYAFFTSYLQTGSDVETKRIEAQRQIESARIEADLKSKPRRVELTRLAAEDIIQKNRGNIEKCISQLKEPAFLNFFFSYSDDGGISTDVLVGTTILRVPEFHTHLPKGVYTWQQLTALLNEHPEAPVRPTPPPSDVDVQKRLYIVANTYEHSRIDVAEFGKKLSVSQPAVNECLVTTLKDSLAGFNALPNDKPFLHRYVTDYGVNLKNNWW